MPLTRFLGRTLLSGATVAGATLGYALWEAQQFTLRRATLPVLPAGRRPLRVLQFTDLHVTPTQSRKIEFIASLASLEPDLVISTGDNLAHADAVPVVLDALGGLADVPGVFVFGSNDYFAPGLRNPLRYLMPDNGSRATHHPPLPWRDLRDGFTGFGWQDLTNSRAVTTVDGVGIDWAGVDDPHLKYDDLDAVAGPADPSADLRLAVAHAPYLRVLDQFAADGYDAILAGHTHGGQVCLPGVGALATNCDLEPARAKGLHRHPAASVDGDPGSSWLHVSAGVGTNPYTPIRVACRPEVTLLDLVSRG